MRFTYEATLICDGPLDERDGCKGFTSAGESFESVMEAEVAASAHALLNEKWVQAGRTMYCPACAAAMLRPKRQTTRTKEPEKPLEARP